MMMSTMLPMPIYMITSISLSALVEGIKKRVDVII